MEKVLINQETAEFQSPESKTIGDFIHDLNDQKISQRDVITILSVNGSVISEENREWMFDQPVEQLESVEIETEDALEVASEAVETAVEHAEALIPVLKLSAQAFREENDELGNENFLLGMEALEGHLAGIMQNLLKARENDDTIALAELLDMDLPENLNLWKNQALPQMIQNSST